MNARQAVERLVELKASFLKQAKTNSERHNRDLDVEIVRLGKVYFKGQLSDYTIEQIVTEVLKEIAPKEIKEVDKSVQYDVSKLTNKQLRLFCKEANAVYRSIKHFENKYVGWSQYGYWVGMPYKSRLIEVVDARTLFEL